MGFNKYRTAQQQIRPASRGRAPRQMNAAGLALKHLVLFYDTKLPRTRFSAPADWREILHLADLGNHCHNENVCI